jgi:signal transduction histidine kinase
MSICYSAKSQKIPAVLKIYQMKVEGIEMNATTIGGAEAINNIPVTMIKPDTAIGCKAVVSDIDDREKLEKALKNIALKISMIEHYAREAKARLEKGENAETSLYVGTADGYSKNISKVITSLRESGEISREDRLLLHDLWNSTTPIIAGTSLAVVLCEAKNYDKLTEALVMIEECSRIAEGQIRETYENISVQGAFHMSLKQSECRGERAGEVRVIMDVPPAQIMINEKHGAGFVRMMTNIFINAFDAIAAKTKSGSDDGAEKILHVYLHKVGDAINIIVVDNGIGMTPEVREKVFEENFSTKGKDGNGIGLYNCKKFVENMKGSISVSSAVGSGTIISIDLPGSLIGK